MHGEATRAHAPMEVQAMAVATAAIVVAATDSLAVVQKIRVVYIQHVSTTVINGIAEYHIDNDERYSSSVHAHSPRRLQPAAGRPADNPSPAAEVTEQTHCTYMYIHTRTIQWGKFV